MTSIYYNLHPVEFKEDNRFLENFASVLLRETLKFGLSHFSPQHARV